MERVIQRYINKETGNIAFKRLVVKQIDGLFRVCQETDRGYGAGITTAILTSIKPYKTQKGAEKALQAWKAPRYRMTVAEGLMQEGKI